MSNRRAERKLGGDIVYLDEIAGRLEEIGDKLDRLLAFSTVQLSPMARMFRRDQQYQFATIQAGQSGQVYLLENPQPELLVGLINEVGNTWFPNTYLEWIVDGVPKTVQYQIAPVSAPKEYGKGIPFDDRVIWRAYNQDAVGHVFEVLCDGFFVDRKVYRRIAPSPR